MAMVTGAGPQANVTVPPRATARTTAAEVQPAGVPFPTTVAGEAAAGAAARRPAAMHVKAILTPRTLRPDRERVASSCHRSALRFSQRSAKKPQIGGR
jgi:hypothetical protein